VPDDGPRGLEHVAQCYTTLKCSVGCYISFVCGKAKHNGMCQNKIKKKLNTKMVQTTNVMNDNRHVYMIVQSNYFSYEGKSFIAQFSHGILS
jgi:hypothetical protein